MTEETNGLKESSYTAGIFNAIVQASAITSYYYLNVSWPMYIVMGMVVLLGIIQTIAAAGVLSNLVEYDKKYAQSYEHYHILIGFIYCASAYQIYLMGFVFFSGFAFAHAILYTMLVLFKRLKT